MEHQDFHQLCLEINSQSSCNGEFWCLHKQISAFIKMGEDFYLLGFSSEEYRDWAFNKSPRFIKRKLFAIKLC